MLTAVKRCPIPECGTKIGRTQGLCSTHNIDIAKYANENPTYVAAYVAAGLAELATYLDHQAAFTNWLINHGGTA